jgi:hypothetical protein
LIALSEEAVEGSATVVVVVVVVVVAAVVVVVVVVVELEELQAARPTTTIAPAHNVAICLARSFACFAPPLEALWPGGCSAEGIVRWVIGLEGPYSRLVST